MPQLLAIPAIAAGIGSSGLAALGSGATALGATGMGASLGGAGTALGGVASSLGAASGLQGLLGLAGLAGSGGGAAGAGAPVIAKGATEGAVAGAMQGAPAAAGVVPTAAEGAALETAVSSVPAGGSAIVGPDGAITVAATPAAEAAYDAGSKIAGLKAQADALGEKAGQAMALKNLLTGGPPPPIPGGGSARGRARRASRGAPVVKDTTGSSRQDAEIEQLIALILGGKR